MLSKDVQMILCIIIFLPMNIWFWWFIYKSFKYGADWWKQ